MARVTVYRFKAYSHLEGQSMESSRMGTRKAIEKIGGTVIEGTGVEIEEARLEIDGLTPKDFVS